jgi:hypothetical protein
MVVTARPIFDVFLIRNYTVLIATLPVEYRRNLLHSLFAVSLVN